MSATDYRHGGPETMAIVLGVAFTLGCCLALACLGWS